MIKQVMMSPAMALYHWRENKMSIDKVLSHTGFKRWSDLHEEYVYDQIAREWAEDDMLMTPQERQREEDVEAVWTEFGDYLREMVPPSQYELEIERLLPLVIATRRIEDAARSKPFRDAVKRRNSLQ